MADISSLAVDAVFTHLADAATFTPAGGDPVAVKVMPSQPDADLGGFGATRHRGQRRVFELRASEAATVKKGDALVVGADSLTITDAEVRDPDRLVWVVECVPA